MACAVISGGAYGAETGRPTGPAGTPARPRARRTVDTARLYLVAAT